MSALVIGEALVDVVDGVPVPGGSPANVAVALARAGIDVTFATQLGDDAYGDLLRDHLTAAGVTLLACRGSRTSSAVATIGESAAATYDFDIVWEPSWPELPAAAITHVGSFSALSVTPAAGPLSYDLNIRPAVLPPDAPARVLGLVGRASIVKGSDEDLAWLSPGLVAGWLRWGEDWLRVGGLAVAMAAEAVGRRGA